VIRPGPGAIGRSRAFLPARRVRRLFRGVVCCGKRGAGLGDAPLRTRHDRHAGVPVGELAAKAALREEVWSPICAAKVARFPGATGRVPNFTGAEAAALFWAD
jgi:hypothetical protein